MAQYEVTHDVDEDDARTIEAGDAFAAVKRWTLTDPYADEYSDSFDAWVREVGQTTWRKVRVHVKIVRQVTVSTARTK